MKKEGGRRMGRRKREGWRKSGREGDRWEGRKGEGR